MLLYILIGVIVYLILQSLTQKKEHAIQATQVKSDTFIEFKSERGYTIIAPSRWTAIDGEKEWAIKSSDQQAQILVYLMTGPVDLDQVLSDILIGLGKNVEAATKSEWKDIQIAGLPASRVEFTVGGTDSETAVRFYDIKSLSQHIVIVLMTEKLVMELNGKFYEQVIASFKA